MTAEIANTKPAPRRKRRKLIAWIIAATLLALGVWYLNSDAFEERIRERVVAELERSTGGRVDLPSFEWHITKLEFIAKDLTIHGTESPGDPPYAHVDYLKVRLKILSFFGRQIGLRSVEAQHPVVHLVVRSDGATNQPSPVLQKSAEKPAPVFERIFDLAIDDLTVSNGVFEWNEKRVPIEIKANEVAVRLNYSPAS